MKTLVVQVEDQWLDLVKQLLASLPYVQRTEDASPTTVAPVGVNPYPRGTYEAVKWALDRLPQGGIMREIGDPVEWQRVQRTLDEERDTMLHQLRQS